MAGILTGEQLLPFVKGALAAAYVAVTKKGPEARAIAGTSVDIKTKGDVAVNDAWTAYFGQVGLPLALYTEELAEPLSFSNKPDYSAVGDEVDGSRNQHFGLGMLPHGSVIGIAEGADPCFNGFICSGFLEFNSGNLFYAVKGKGSYLVEKWASGGTLERRLATSGRNKFSKDTSVVADSYMLGSLAPFFAHYSNCIGGGDFRSTAVHLALVAAGMLDVFVFADNCLNMNKLRTGEELGPCYLLVKEAGGAILGWDGKDLGSEKVGLDKKKAFHVVAAATTELGRAFASDMRRIPEVVEYMRRKNL